MKLLKIAEKDCPVCKKLSLFDSQIAESLRLNFEELTVSQVIAIYPHVKDHVTQYHSKEDQSVGLPIYLILSDTNDVKASKQVVSIEQLNQLLILR